MLNPRSSNGFFLTLLALGRHARTHLALPRFLHGSVFLRSRALARLGSNGPSIGCSAPALSKSRPGSATPARWSSHVRLFGIHVLILRIQGSLPLNRNTRCRRFGTDSIPTTHSSPTPTAELRRRDHHVLLLPDGASPFSSLSHRRTASPRHRAGARFSRRKSPTIGNFWVDMTRCLFYILLPVALCLWQSSCGEGAVETLAGTRASTTS